MGKKFDFDFEAIDQIIDRIDDREGQANRAKERNRIEKTDADIKKELERQGFIVSEN